MRGYLRDRITEWKAWGDLTDDLDTERAVDVLIGAYERSVTGAGVRLPLEMWCESFYKVMMEQNQQVRFSYLRGVRAKAARH
jgi:hypothetical protein